LYEEIAQKEEGIQINELDISMLLISTFCHINLFSRSTYEFWDSKTQCCSVPVKGSTAEVDWNFLERIYENRDLRPYPVPEEERVGFTFEAAKYHDAVIMPWYRNQDQPQVSLFTSYRNRATAPSSVTTSEASDIKAAGLPEPLQIRQR
jgi:hypothetical protein